MAGYLQAKARSVTTLARMLIEPDGQAFDAGIGRRTVVVNAYEKMALERKNNESN